MLRIDRMEVKHFPAGTQKRGERAWGAQEGISGVLR